MEDNKKVITYNPFTGLEYKGEQQICDTCGKRTLDLSNDIYGERLIGLHCFECLNKIAFDEFWGDMPEGEFNQWFVGRD